MQTYQHWRLERDEDKVLWLYFDKKGSSVNTIDREVMEELATIIESIKQDPDCKGLVLASAKKSGFIAGADISQFNQFKDINEAVQMLKKGQTIFDELEKLSIPTAAMIEGFCLGGGLELALACDYRIAEDGLKTRLGLPEVKLGIHPGWGGSVRLPRLIGAMKGLNLVMSGHTVSGKAAYKLGFVDAAVPPRHLKKAAKEYVLKQPKKSHPTSVEEFSNSNAVRSLLTPLFRKKLREKVNPLHYPAPFDVLNNWELVGVYGQKAFDQEARTCGRLFFSETSHNLVRVFFLQERLKKLAKDIHFKPKHIHVIGAGTMGGDIAAWCAFQGFTVTLQDREAKFIAPAIKRAFALFKEKLKDKHLVQQAADRLIPDIQGHGITRADVIIEAIFEDLLIKQNLFKELEKKAKPDAVLATNTSSIPLDEISEVMNNPGRLVGIHFFNPVAKMPLVEVAASQRTDRSVIDKAIGFTKEIAHLPLPVKSSPGFLVNRVLMPYLLESVALLDEGVEGPAIDKAMVDFGMPMGPVALADAVGLDVCLSVANHLSRYFKIPVPQRLEVMVAEGKLGRKTGQGFYTYKQGKQVKTKILNTDCSYEDIANRLVSRLVDEALACLHEGVVADGDLVDAGMVFGTGFAPFRGGPIHYAHSRNFPGSSSPERSKSIRDETELQTSNTAGDRAP